MVHSKVVWISDNKLLGGRMAQSLAPAWAKGVLAERRPSSSLAIVSADANNHEASPYRPPVYESHYTP